MTVANRFSTELQAECFKAELCATRTPICNLPKYAFRPFHGLPEPVGTV